MDLVLKNFRYDFKRFYGADGNTTFFDYYMGRCLEIDFSELGAVVVVDGKLEEDCLNDLVVGDLYWDGKKFVLKPYQVKVVK